MGSSAWSFTSGSMVCLSAPDRAASSVAVLPRLTGPAVGGRALLCADLLGNRQSSTRPVVDLTVRRSVLVRLGPI
jgi:hypothetical protein